MSCYDYVPDQPSSAMGNCKESAGRKKDCPFFQIKVEQFNISIHQVYKSEYDYLCMSCKYDIFTSFMYVYIIFVLNHYCKYDIFTSFMYVQ